jgi:hypothetical protein
VRDQFARYLLTLGIKSAERKPVKAFQKFPGMDFSFSPEKNYNCLVYRL